MNIEKMSDTVTSAAAGRGGWYRLGQYSPCRGFCRRFVLGPIRSVSVAIAIAIGVNDVPSPFVPQCTIGEGKEGQE